MSVPTASTPIQPYDAWWFFAADDKDEVDRAYEDYRVDAEDGGYPTPDLAAPVRVVAAADDRGFEVVWFVHRGQLMKRDSWQVREAVR